MKSSLAFAWLLASTLVLAGCQRPVTEATGATTGQLATIELADQIVETSCGQCQFGMAGAGCELAVRVDGQSWFVDGVDIDDFGDAHGTAGLCNCIRKAKVSGVVRDGRLVATGFEILPPAAK